MTDLLDVVTRTYEYRRAQPALFVGTMSGLETAQLALHGKLPTPILATLGHLACGGGGRPRCLRGFASRVAIQPARNRTRRMALRAARLSARVRGPHRAARR